MGDRYGFEAEHLTVERNFNPEIGFLRREDFRRNFGMFRFSPRPAGPSPDPEVPVRDELRSLHRHQRPPRDAGGDGAGRRWTSRTATSGAWSSSNNYEFLDEPFEIADGLFLPVGGYRFNEVEARYTIGPQRKVNGSAVGRRRPVLRRHAHGSRLPGPDRADQPARHRARDRLQLGRPGGGLVRREAPDRARHLQPVAAQGADGACPVQLRRRPRSGPTCASGGSSAPARTCSSSTTRAATRRSASTAPSSARAPSSSKVTRLFRF